MWLCQNKIDARKKKTQMQIEHWLTFLYVFSSFVQKIIFQVLNKTDKKWIFDCIFSCSYIISLSVHSINNFIFRFLLEIILKGGHQFIFLDFKFYITLGLRKETENE